MRSRLRYYSDCYDKNQHEKIVGLLNSINKEWRIQVEIYRVNRKYNISNFTGRIEEISELEAYNRDFKRNIALSHNVGRPPSKAFKTRSGNISITGCVGIYDDGLQWATTYSDKSIKFLEKVHKRGNEFLDSKYDKREIGKRKIHDEFFQYLIGNNFPEPEIEKEDKWWIREVALGFWRLGIKKEDIRRDYDEGIAKRLSGEARRSYKKMCELDIIDGYWYRKYLQKELSWKYGFGKPLYILFADFLILVKDRFWLIEGKGNLNYEAIGQVLSYRYLLMEDNIEFKNIHMGIICNSGNPMLEPTCDKLGIKIFICSS